MYSAPTTLMMAAVNWMIPPASGWRYMGRLVEGGREEGGRGGCKRWVFEGALPHEGIHKLENLCSRPYSSEDGNHSSKTPTRSFLLVRLLMVSLEIALPKLTAAAISERVAASTDFCASTCAVVRLRTPAAPPIKIRPPEPELAKPA